MKLMLLVLSLACIAALATAGQASSSADTFAQNTTEHSWVFVNGYMEESRILQTQSGFAGQKAVLAASGSGMVTRTIDSVSYRDSDMDETALTNSVEFNYKPYHAPLSQSDLRNALCAKNYEVGSVFSETYRIDKDLIKDTKIYQDDSISVYEIGSEIQGSARIGQRVQKNARTVPTMMMGGTYMGYAQIRSETVAGNMSVLTLPCP
jgi:hypothetical protein